MQVFLQTRFSFALVNIKPLLPGHVLVCPRQRHRRLTELSAEETQDLFGTVQRVQRMLARRYFAAAAAAARTARPDDGSFNIALQDGPGAGQTVAHVHVHVIPRVHGATAMEVDESDGDQVYEEMASEPGNVGGALWDREADRTRPQPGGAFPPIEEATRQARSMAEMEAEAELYRTTLRDMGEE